MALKIDMGFAPNRQQDIIGTNDSLVYWRIGASFNLKELSPADYG